MKKYQKINNKNIALVGTIFGGVLIGLPAIPLAASAQPLSTLAQVNPCPGIYYEEPFNTTRIVPQGCPPNAATRGVPTRGMVPDRAALRDREAFTEPSTPALPPAGVPQPPLPEAHSNPIAMVQHCRQRKFEEMREMREMGEMGKKIPQILILFYTPIPLK